MGNADKSSEAKYLNNLVAAMESVVESLNPYSPRAQLEDSPRWLAGTLATLVSYRVVAEIIAEYAPGKDSQKLCAKADKVLERGRKKAWALARTWGVDMSLVIQAGSQATAAFMPQLTTDDFILLFEHGHKGHANYRRKAARAVLGRSEQDVVDAAFWRIVSQP